MEVVVGVKDASNHLSTLRIVFVTVAAGEQSDSAIGVDLEVVAVTDARKVAHVVGVPRILICVPCVYIAAPARNAEPFLARLPVMWHGVPIVGAYTAERRTSHNSTEPRGLSC
jgi:hypothetical protein